MTTIAAYDPHADWYEETITDPANTYFPRVAGVLRDLLGPGAGTCLDLCCGTGINAMPVRECGWTPVGVDLSAGQLRHARQRLPIARGDATALPVADGSVPAAVCVLAHTDMPDYAAALREIARVLRPGGRFVHLGVHPCYVGAFADRSDTGRIVIDTRYDDRSHTYDSWTLAGVRARVGAWHLTLADLLNATHAAGLWLVRAVESGPAGGVVDVFGFVAYRALSGIHAPDGMPAAT